MGVEEDAAVVLQVLVPVLDPGHVHVVVYALVQGKILKFKINYYYNYYYLNYYSLLIKLLFCLEVDHEAIPSQSLSLVQNLLTSMYYSVTYNY